MKLRAGKNAWMGLAFAKQELQLVLLSADRQLLTTDKLPLAHARAKIKQIWREFDTPSCKLIASLSAAQVLMGEINLPTIMSAEEMYHHLRYLLPATIGSNESYYLDYEKLTANEQVTHLRWVLTPQQRVMALQKKLAQIGLTAACVAVDLLAYLCLWQHLSLSKLGLLYVIEEQSMAVAVIQAGKMQWQRLLPSPVSGDVGELEQCLVYGYRLAVTAYQQPLDIWLASSQAACLQFDMAKLSEKFATNVAWLEASEQFVELKQAINPAQFSLSLGLALTGINNDDKLTALARTTIKN